MSRSEHLSTNRLLDLVHGLANQDSLRAWLGHVRSCPLCEARLRLATEDHRRAQAELPSVVATLDRGRAAAGAAARKPGARRSWLPAVAAMAAVIVVAWVLVPRGPNPVLTSHLRPLPNGVEFVAQRSTDPTGNSCLRDAMRAYDAARYGEAVRALRDCEAAGAAAAMRDLYLGSALAFDGRYAESVRALERVPRAAIPETWRRDLDWTLCVAFYGEGRIQAADSLLAVLETPDEDARARATRLRTALRGAGRRGTR